MPAQKLKAFLDEQGVKYLSLVHSPAYRAQELAARLHVHGWDLAKTTILKVDGAYVMAVLPAPAYVDVMTFRQIMNATTVRLATEAELPHLFPGCEVGAMPPFGNLFGLPVYVDARLAQDPAIVFCAGSHREAIRMDFADYARIVKPTIVAFGTGIPRAPRPAAAPA